MHTNINLKHLHPLSELNVNDNEGCNFRQLFLPASLTKIIWCDNKCVSLSWEYVVHAVQIHSYQVYCSPLNWHVCEVSEWICSIKICEGLLWCIWCKTKTQCKLSTVLIQAQANSIFQSELKSDTVKSVYHFLATNQTSRNTLPLILKPS